MTARRTDTTAARLAEVGVVPLPICPGSLRDGNRTQRKPRDQESVKLKSERRRRKGNSKRSQVKPSLTAQLAETAAEFAN